MYRKNVLKIAYIINVYFVINNTAVNLSYGHRKTELSCNNYPVIRSVFNTREFHNYQQNEINDPGYITNNENSEDKIISPERNTNMTSYKHFVSHINPSAQLFHMLNMPSHSQSRQHLPGRQDEKSSFKQFNSDSENLAYAGPHLFPNQKPNKKQNINQLYVLNRNSNATFHNTYPTQFLLRPYGQDFIKDSKVKTKMEAPFVPSQFLGYNYDQIQQLSQPPQQLIQQNQQIYQVHNQMFQQLQQNQLLPQQSQQTLNTGSEYQHHEDSPYQISNLIYMAPNTVYDIYRKLN